MSLKFRLLIFVCQLRPNLNTSHTRNKRRPRHKISIFAFVVPFAFGNKQWFEISFSNTM